MVPKLTHYVHDHSRCVLLKKPQMTLHTDPIDFLVFDEDTASAFAAPAMSLVSFSPSLGQGFCTGACIPDARIG